MPPEGRDVAQTSRRSQSRLGSAPLLGATSLLLALLLGGGTRSGFLSDALLQLATLPILLLVAWRLLDAPLTRDVRSALLFCLALALLPLLQLLPLPPPVWTALPGRAAVADATKLVFGAPGWRPVTLAPPNTAQAALSLVPTAAVFGATLLLTLRERRWIAVVAVAAGLAEATVGLMQISGGPLSPLRPYAVTSLDAAVGLFANPNHFALALALAITAVVAWGVTSGPETERSRSAEMAAKIPLANALAATTAVFVLLLGIIASRSRAGLALALLSLTCTCAVARWRPAGLTPKRMVLIAIAGSLVGTIALLVFAPAPFAALIARLMDGGGYGPRSVYALRTAAIAWDVLPFGTGIGSFVPVYALFEQSADIPAGVFVNRAHCDWIEAVLESGVFGIALLAIFCAWFGRTAWRLWRRSKLRTAGIAPGESAIDVALARAATIAVTLIGLHSLVDYPLRTAGIAALFAFACGCLFAPAGANRQTASRAGGTVSRSFRLGRRGLGVDVEPATAG